MSTKNAAPTRPAFIACCLCHGQVAVAPKGNIPNAHFACAEILRTLRRLQSNIDDCAATENVNMVEVVTMLKRDAWGAINDACNKHANPAKRAAKR